VKLLDSPRRRRRLFRLAVVVAVLGAGVAIAVAFWNTAKPIGKSSGPETGSVPEQSVPRQVRLTAETRRQVHATLTRFVATAVTRRNVTAAFGLVTPKLRAGMTRKEWAKGDIPVYPYPARRDVEISRYVGSFKNDVLLDVLLQPRKSAKNLGPIAFEVEMRAVGSGARRRWLVDSFVPSAAFAPTNAPPPKVTSKTSTAAPSPGYGAGHLSAKWFVFPALILALIFLVPAGFALRSWYLNRRAEREYRSERPLPPLPKRD
jgi:hypothetical protein